MRGELAAFVRLWWCRGGGMAVLALMAVVSVFRHPRDVIFWAAAAFLAGHTAQTIRRYLIERKARITATVIRHHESHPTGTGLVFSPRPATSLLVPLKITTKDLAQQTKYLL